LDMTSFGQNGLGELLSGDVLWFPGRLRLFSFSPFLCAKYTLPPMAAPSYAQLSRKYYI
jgi:hypothetical protein